MVNDANLVSAAPTAHTPPSGLSYTMTGLNKSGNSMRRAYTIAGEGTPRLIQIITGSLSRGIQENIFFNDFPVFFRAISPGAQELAAAGSGADRAKVERKHWGEVYAKLLPQIAHDMTQAERDARNAKLRELRRKYIALQID